MCGRFTGHSTVHEFTELVKGLVFASPDEPRPRYNVAPSQQALVAREHFETRQRDLVRLKWGAATRGGAETS